MSDNAPKTSAGGSDGSPPPQVAEKSDIADVMSSAPTSQSGTAVPVAASDSLSTAAGKPSLTFNEKLTLILSGIALLVSLLSAVLTLYFQFFWVKHDLRVAMLSHDVTRESTNAGNRLNLELAIVNRGNQPAILNAAWMQFYAWYQPGKEWLPQSVGSIDRPDALPMLLEPGRMAVLKLSEPLDYERLHTEGRSVDAKTIGREGVREVQMGIHVEAMTSDGKILRHAHSFFPLQITRTNWIGISESASVLRMGSNH